MKFLYSFILFTSFILSAYAQRAFIGLPVEGTSIKRGIKFTVQLVRPNSLQGSTEVGLVIGLIACDASITPQCPPPNTRLGNILFNGDFNPQFHEQPGRPYQNFTVKMPADFPVGLAQVSTARFHLIGAGPSPVLEFNNVTVNVV